MIRLSQATDRRQFEFISLMLRRAISETAEACQQCGKCPSSCPVSRHIEGFNPRQIIAKISLEKIDELLRSDMLWTCSSCLKCKERCPENVSPYDAILALRTLAYRSGYSYPPGYDDFIKAVASTGASKEPQEVRTRMRERRDRASLNLPEAERPRNLRKFNDTFNSILREDGEV